MCDRSSLKRDLVDQADLDVAVLDLGLAGLETLGIVEHDRDLRPLLLQRGVGEPDRDRAGDQRNQPDQRDAAALLDLDLGQLVALKRGRVVP